MPALIRSATDHDFAAAVAGGVALVDFWAPWCGPCRALSPLLEELAEEFQGQVRFLKVNSDENPGCTAGHGVMSVPTLLLFQDGRLVGRLAGARPKGQLRAFIQGTI